VSEPRRRIPDVTVVIPTRNRVAFLAEAITSVRTQRGVNWEVVVVDDASDDDSVAAVRVLIDGDHRMRLIALDTHSERSAARNLGLESARGRFVLFLDDDDRLVSGSLTRLAQALAKDPDASVAIGARRAFDGRGHVRREPHPRFRVRRTLTSELLLGWLGAWFAVPGQCLIRTDLLRSSGGWNETLVGPEDQELLLRLTARRPAILLPQPALEYRLHDSQWRPADVREQEAAFRRDMAKRLEHAGRDDAQNLLRAGELLRAAGASYDRADYRTTIRLMATAGRTAPSILRSPVIGPTFVHVVAKASVGAVLGPALARGVRRLRQRQLRRRGHSPEASVVVLSESETPPGRGEGYRAVLDGD